MPLAWGLCNRLTTQHTKWNRSACLENSGNTFYTISFRSFYIIKLQLKFYPHNRSSIKGNSSTVGFLDSLEMSLDNLCTPLSSASETTNTFICVCHVGISHFSSTHSYFLPNSKLFQNILSADPSWMCESLLLYVLWTNLAYFALALQRLYPIHIHERSSHLHTATFVDVVIQIASEKWALSTLNQKGKIFC